MCADYVTPIIKVKWTDLLENNYLNKYIRPFYAANKCVTCY